MYQEKFERLIEVLQALGMEVNENGGSIAIIHHTSADQAIPFIKAEVRAVGGGPQPEKAGGASKSGGAPPADHSRQRTADFVAGMAMPEGLFAAIYERIRQRAQQDPGILELLAARPELRVKVERPVIAATGVQAILGQLLHDGFFNGKGVAAKAVEKELDRRGGDYESITIYKALIELCRLGFLTKEEVGKRQYVYRAVPGMKVTVEK